MTCVIKFAGYFLLSNTAFSSGNKQNIQAGKRGPCNHGKILCHTQPPSGLDRGDKLNACMVM